MKQYSGWDKVNNCLAVFADAVSAMSKLGRICTSKKNMPMRNPLLFLEKRERCRIMGWRVCKWYGNNIIPLVHYSFYFVNFIGFIYLNDMHIYHLARFRQNESLISVPKEFNAGEFAKSVNILLFPIRQKSHKLKQRK